MRQYRTLMAGYVAELGPAEVGYLDRLCAAPVNWEPAFEMSREFAAGLDLLAGAQAVVAPALAIGCEFDVTVPAAAMRLVAEELPNGHFLKLAGVGHFPEVEAPAEFRAAVTVFLAGSSPADRSRASPRRATSAADVPADAAPEGQGA